MNIITITALAITIIFTIVIIIRHRADWHQWSVSKALYLGPFCNGSFRGAQGVGPRPAPCRVLTFFGHFFHVFLHASSALLESILAPIWPPLWIKIWPEIVKSQVLQTPSKEQPKNLPLSVENGSFE